MTKQQSLCLAAHVCTGAVMALAALALGPSLAAAQGDISVSPSTAPSQSPTMSPTTSLSVSPTEEPAMRFMFLVSACYRGTVRARFGRASHCPKGPKDFFRAGGGHFRAGAHRGC